MSTTEQEPSLLQYAETAKLLNVSVPTLKNWVRCNKIPYIRFPARSIRFNRAEILNWVESCSNAPTEFKELKSEKQKRNQLDTLTKAGFARHGLKTPVKENNAN
jgi:excisionase family DNA binding protein